MASLRDAIAMELVARLAALPGWTARMRSGDEQTNVPVLALVAITSEQKRPTSQLFYGCTLNLGVLIQARKEDADDELDGGNPVRYLDRLVAEAEAAVHSAPWPNEELPTLTGHSIEPLEEENLLGAELTLSVQYRHNFDDPTTYDPTYVP